jgi:hypothetical protein
MRSLVEHELQGEVRGGVFTTSSLSFDSSPLCRATNPEARQRVAVVWNGEEGWRLTRLYHRGVPDPLPGKDHVLGAPSIRLGSPKVFIVLANRNSGLFSCHNWLRCGKHALKTLSVNLVEVQDACNDPDERIMELGRVVLARAIAYQETLKRLDPESSFDAGRLPDADPFRLLSLLGGCGEPAPEAVLLRNFDVLDAITAERLFGRLRALYESGSAPGLPSLVLLGHSTASLDPADRSSASSLLTLANSYTLSNLRETEVLAMARILATSSQAGEELVSGEAVQRVMHWTGGHPHLVQAIFYLLQSNSAIRSVDDAIRFLDRERLPAFEGWVQRLRRSLADPEIGRMVGAILRKRRFLRSSFEHRISVLELLVQGWIRLDRDEDAWVFRSECHRKLATEAFGQRG